jgi:hypothetical protein
MADSLFDTPIQTIINQLTTDIPTASVDNLVILARMIKSVKQTENINLESLLNSRVNTLLTNASSVDDVAALSNAVGKMIDVITPDTSTGKELPEQDGYNGRFLTTDGTNMSWDTLEFADFRDINHASLSDGDFLVYDSGSGKYIGEATIPSNVTATEVTTQANLPSGTFGDFATTTDTSTVYFYNGTDWVEFGTF